MVFWSQASRFQALRFHLQGSSASGFQSSSWFQASNLPGKGLGYKAWRCDGARFEGCAVPGIHGFRFQGFHGAKVRVPGSWVSKHPGIQTRQRFQDQVSVPTAEAWMMPCSQCPRSHVVTTKVPDLQGCEVRFQALLMYIAPSTRRTKARRSTPPQLLGILSGPLPACRASPSREINIRLCQVVDPRNSGHACDMRSNAGELVCSAQLDHIWSRQSATHQVPPWPSCSGLLLHLFSP